MKNNTQSTHACTCTHTHVHTHSHSHSPPTREEAEHASPVTPATTLYDTCLENGRIPLETSQRHVACDVKDSVLEIAPVTVIVNTKSHS